MARPRLNPDDETTEIRVRMPVSDRDQLRAAADHYGLGVAEFARKAIAAAVRGALQPSMTIDLPAPSRPAPKPTVKGRVRPGASAHTHHARRLISGGIAVCECEAKLLGGVWVMP